MENRRPRYDAPASCYFTLLLLVSIAFGGDHVLRQCAAKCHFENGNFSHSCIQIFLDPDNLVLLRATCKSGGAPNAKFVKSSVGLNANIRNNNGQLECSVCLDSPLVPRHCNFSHSCRDLRLTGATLYATCDDRNGKPVATSLDLDRCIENHEGDLQFVCGFGFTIFH
ncbi:hypothetical protein KP509_09G026900 [Ceratopteris richardii]|uniref:Cyanovirin-N domain-containing protein n=1 Tax=Ceratopteris richardii TaxID=49495 RepID=A0A8T2U5H9_CERRI|nr:hypothetical protein KP509_09G026900 [Ceratopteris richardii]